MSNLPPFKNNNTLTVGIELELQLVNLHSFNLIMEAKDFLRRVSETEHSGVIKPEITQSMIEINTSIHSSYPSLLKELYSLRDILTREARQTHIGICGGGAHPFQKWAEQRIFPTERFSNLSEQYGYLAQQFTVFGQHIHVSCSNGNDALYLCHAMIRYIPHFIALSAASPFSYGVDTSFDCSRLANISAFPLSGTLPWIHTWEEFEQYFKKMATLGIVKSMKDFYWDIRPKPEFGTIELRICDTPLTVDKAADLAAYAQTLVCWLLHNRQTISREIYLTYLTNRFRAARYGLSAIYTDPTQEAHISIADDILQTCDQLEAYAIELGNEKALARIRAAALSSDNDARWIRAQYADLKSLPDTVRVLTKLWSTHSYNPKT